MSHQQSHGRRLVTMGDRWRQILAGQPRPPEAITPAGHVGARWCGHAWACDCAPEARPATPDTPPEEGAAP
jgi:hypothetical protein